MAFEEMWLQFIGWQNGSLGCQAMSCFTISWQTGNTSSGVQVGREKGAQRNSRSQKSGVHTTLLVREHELPSYPGGCRLTVAARQGWEGKWSFENLLAARAA